MEMEVEMEMEEVDFVSRDRGMSRFGLTVTSKQATNNAGRSFIGLFRFLQG